MEWLQTLGFALGAAWLSGFRLYACVGVLGLSHYLGWSTLPGGLDVLADPRVFGISLILFVVEFFADKIPWLDSGWDTVNTFIRIPAGAILASAAFADHQPWLKVVAFLLGGGIAMASHGAKAGIRLAVNHSPEPVSNWVTSFAEDGAAGVSLALLIWLPIMMIVVVAGGIFLTYLAFRKVKPILVRRMAKPEPPV